MLESDTGTPTASAPATPGTPGAPLFTSLRVDSLSYDRKSMPRCGKCLPVESWTSPHTCFTEFPKPDVSLTRKLGAEFVGTFILIFGATAAPIVNQKYNGAETLIGNAACAGLAVMIVILSTGHISGAHLNPSLTIAFAVLRHFPWVQVPAYIAAQVSASICASYALKGIFHPYLSGGVTVPSVSTAQAFFLEFIITFNLLFVVTAVATDTRAVTIHYLYLSHYVLLYISLFNSCSGRGARWDSCGRYSHAQHTCGRAIEWRINESGEDTGTSSGGRQLQADMDIPGSSHNGGYRRSRRVHRREAEGRGRGDGAPGQELPPLGVADRPLWPYYYYCSLAYCQLC